MSEILKFPNQDKMRSFHEAVDLSLRQLGIPSEFREKAVSWAEREAAQYRIPPIDLSITLPEGLTDEQADHIRREIHREFARYHSALFSAKHEYIIERIKQNLTEFLRTS